MLWAATLWAATLYGAGIVTATRFGGLRSAGSWQRLPSPQQEHIFFRRRSKAAYALALAALFVTGALMMPVRAPENQNSALAFADGRDVVVTAHVTEEGNLRDHSRGDSQQELDLETEQINTSSENSAVRFGIRVSFRRAIFEIQVRLITRDIWRKRNRGTRVSQGRVG
jgi:hypothetical protein